MSAQSIPSTVQNPIALDLSPSYGALIIAAYLGCALWGINVMQSYIYYWNYPEDIWALKMLVAFLLIVDTAHKILITKVPWFTLVQNWGRVSAILASPEEALHEAWVGLIIVVIVQLYYLRRLAKFAYTTLHERSWWLWTVFVVLLLLCISQIPLTVAYLAFSINRVNIFIPINLRLKTAGLIAATIVDLAIAVGMIILLKDTDSIDGRIFRSKRTSRTIRRLTIIIINTGALTATVAIISLVLDETASGTVFWTAIAQYPQCSIYLSAFLANLNARHYIRGDGDDITISNIENMDFATRRDVEASMANKTEQRVVINEMGSAARSGRTDAQDTADQTQVAHSSEHIASKYSHPT